MAELSSDIVKCLLTLEAGYRTNVLQKVDLRAYELQTDRTRYSKVFNSEQVLIVQILDAPKRPE
jgi:hypothetical protein